MPVYTFEDINTGEVVEYLITFDEMEQYLKENPDKRQVFRMNIVDPVGAGITKPPADFQKYVLGKVKAANPHSDAVASKRWGIPKEV